MKTLVSALLLICFTSAQVRADTVLGITTAEIANWASRAASGPYKSAGDASTNSPGDWDRIVSIGADLPSNPTQETWTGNTNNEPWHQDILCGGQTCTPSEWRGYKILNAAFAYMVLPGTHNWVAAVRTALLDQAGQAGTDFTNATKWNQTESIGHGNSFGITTWLTKIAFAYSYVRNDAAFSAGDRTTIDTWLSNAAFYWARNNHYQITSEAFPEREAEYDTSVAVGSTYPTDIANDGIRDPGFQGVVTHYDCTNTSRGHYSGSFQSIWANRGASQMRFAAVGAHINGSLPNDAQTKRWTKMWFMEWLTYGVFDDSMVNDYQRWADQSNNPTNGWSYAGNAIGSMATIADTFARAGDTSLYDYSTSGGWVFSNCPSGFNCNTNGGPKSLLTVMQRHTGFVNQRSTQSPNWTASDDFTYAGGPHCAGDRLDYLIQPQDIPWFGGTDTARINDTQAIQANLYYRDAGIKAAYTRTASGAPAYPATAEGTGGADNAWSGEWGVYPGVLFMYGQMETNPANPFLDGEPPPSGSGQLELRVIRKLQ